MKNGGKRTYKTSQKTSRNVKGSFFCPLAKHLYKDFNFNGFSSKAGLTAIFLLFFFTQSGYSTVTIDPGAPVSVQNYGNQLATKISPDFNINITVTGAPDVFNVSVSKAVETSQNLKAVTYQIRNNMSSVDVLSAGIAAVFTGATSPVQYSGSKLFDGMKIIFPASDPIAEMTRMILRSKNNPAVDEVDFESKGRYWKILTGAASEDTVDDQHFHGGGTVSDQIKHAEHEKMIELVKYADVTDRIVRSGNWSDASIWESSHVPQTGSKVFVAEGLTITVDGEFMTQVPFTVRIDGVIRFKTTVNTGLKVRTLVVNSMGSFYMGEAIDRIRTGVTSQILIADRGVRDAAARLCDPLDLDGGVIAHGKVFNMFGEDKTGHATPIEELKIGVQQINFVQAPIGWHVGDTLLFPTTADPDYFTVPDQDELIAISAISADKKTITLSQALKYNHLAPAGVMDPKDTGKLLRIPVGNLTRNAFFKSEITYLPPPDISPVTSDVINSVQANLSRRGHFMVMHAQSGVLIDGAGFYDLGRTNARIGSMMTVHTIPMLDADEHVIPGTDTNTIGRYALHIHGRTGADVAKNPIRISNCAITRSPKHGLVNHGGNVIATGNVTYNIAGSHFFAENGSEIGAFVNNLAVGSLGPVGSGGDNLFLLGAFNQTTNNDTVPAFDTGGNGFGIWMQGTGIRVLDNYAFHHRNSAFAYYPLGLKEGLKDSSLAEWLRVPEIDFQVSNLDVTDADGNVDPEKAAAKNALISEGKQTIPIFNVPTTFARNVGGSSGTGLFSAYLHHGGGTPIYDKIQDSVFWGIVSYGVNTRYSQRIHFKNITVIKEPSRVNLVKYPDYRLYGGGFGGNERTKSMTYDQVYVEGFAGGISIPIYGDNVVKDSFLKNIINIYIPAPRTENSITGFDPGDDRHVTIQNVRFEALNQRGYNNEPSLDIFLGGRFIHDNPDEGADPTLWLMDKNRVEIIGQDVNAIRIGSDYIPLVFYDRFYITLVSPKLTNRLLGYVAAAKRMAYPASAILYSKPVNLNEGWNYIPITVPAWTSDCVHEPVGCQPQVRTVMVYGDTTPPTFVPDPQVQLTIDSGHLSQGFYLMGNIIDQTGNFKMIQNFSRNFTNLTIDPDGKVRLRFSVSDQAGNTANVVIPLSVNVSTYMITAQAGGGGAISPSGSITVDAGSKPSFTITANAGYQINNIIVDGVALTGSGGCDGTSSFVSPYVYTFSNVNVNHTIGAMFNQMTYTLYMGTDGLGTGTITKSPDLAKYTPGTVVQLTAVANSGSSFKSWGGNLSGNTATQSITMDGNKVVTASFDLISHDRTDASILYDMEKVIRDHPYFPLSGTVNQFPGFDLNGDKMVNASDQIMMRNIWSYGYDNLMAIANKFLPEVWGHLGTSASPSYIYEFDVNKDGMITSYDVVRIRTALIRWTNRTDASILWDMEKVIRDHPWSFNKDVPNPFPGFDLNNDNRVDATDQLMMRNIWTLSYEQFTNVFDKFMGEVTKSVGTAQGNPRYLFEFDVDKNGTITAAVDRGRILTALQHGRYDNGTSASGTAGLTIQLVN